MISCSKIKDRKQQYFVGIDSSFPSLNLQEQSSYIFGFTQDLLQDIATLVKTPFIIVQQTQDNLLSELQQGKYDAVILNYQNSALSDPNSLLAISTPLLSTGSVLVTKTTIHEDILHISPENPSSIIGISQQDLQLIHQYPKAQFEIYQDILQALKNVSEGTYTGAILSLLIANKYLKTTFFQNLKIASNPLTNDKIAFIALRKRKKLVASFTAALQQLDQKGQLCAILKKWNLEETHNKIHEHKKDKDNKRIHHKKIITQIVSKIFHKKL